MALIHGFNLTTLSRPAPLKLRPYGAIKIRLLLLVRAEPCSELSRTQNGLIWTVFSYVSYQQARVKNLERINLIS